MSWFTALSYFRSLHSSSLFPNMGQPVASAGKLGIIYFDESAPLAQKYYLGPGKSGNLPDISKTTGEEHRLVARGVGHKDQWYGWVAVVWDKQGREGMEAIKLLEPNEDKRKRQWLYNGAKRRSLRRDKKVLQTTYVLMAWKDRDERTWECAADLVQEWGWDSCSLMRRLYGSVSRA